MWFISMSIHTTTCLHALQVVLKPLDESLTLVERLASEVISFIPFSLAVVDSPAAFHSEVLSTASL